MNRYWNLALSLTLLASSSALSAQSWYYSSTKNPGTACHSAINIQVSEAKQMLVILLSSDCF